MPANHRAVYGKYLSTCTSLARDISLQLPPRRHPSSGSQMACMSEPHPLLFAAQIDESLCLRKRLSNDYSDFR
jgi:hypothetical protein